MPKMPIHCFRRRTPTERALKNLENFNSLGVREQNSIKLLEKRKREQPQNLTGYEIPCKRKNNASAGINNFKLTQADCAMLNELNVGDVPTLNGIVFDEEFAKYLCTLFEENANAIEKKISL